VTYEIAKTKNYSEGYVKTMGYWLFYRSFGEPGSKGTILCVHGGPGSGQERMTRMANLTEEGLRVIMYDQLGAGKSEKPSNERLYTVERYVDEIEAMRQGLNLGKIHLFGVSFGGFLNVGYGIKYPKNLVSLIIQSGTSSSPVAIAELKRLRNEAPKWVPDTMNRYEEIKDFFNPEYLKAVDYLYRQHICRLDPLPPDIHFPAETRLSDLNYVYRLMWGLHEFYPTGNATNWDVTDNLGSIDCPAMISCGRYDAITPKNSELLHSRIRGSKLHVFESSSHMPIRECPQEFFQVIREFLAQLD